VGIRGDGGGRVRGAHRVFWRRRGYGGARRREELGKGMGEFMQP
jgi:hypothetical protein